MYEELDAYLEEIDRYLVDDSAGKEILSEIRSHILEKAEHEYGEISEESIKKIIADYGSPQQVAGKYAEGYQIISPIFKKYLFHYTWVLFAFHYGLTVICYLLGIKVQVFPFFYIPRMEDFFELINRIPVTLVFDFGLVGLFFYFLTRSKREVTLTWPTIFKRIKEKFRTIVKPGAKPGAKDEVKALPGAESPRKPEKPHIALLLLLTFAFAAVLFIFFRFGTLFFYFPSLTDLLEFEEILPIFTPKASLFFSILVIASLAFQIILYGIRFIKNSWWIDLLKLGAELVALWIIINAPLEDPLLIDIPELGFDPKYIMIFIVAIIAFGIAYDFIRVLFIIIKEKMAEQKAVDKT